MLSNCVVFESVTQEDGVPYQQLSNLQLANLSTNSATLNTDSGKLYGSFTKSGGTYTLNLYKDTTKTVLVAHASSTSLGNKTISSDNSSTLSGSVNFAQYKGDDTNIIVLCYLSQDTDLQMANINSVDDYDPMRGFVDFHIQAFHYIQEFAIGRHRELLFDSNRIDTGNLNGSLGGYDLSRIVNWNNLREASAHWALSRIMERQIVEDDSIFAKRTQTSKELVKTFLERVNIRFDQNFDRVDDKARSFAITKLKRS